MCVEEGQIIQWPKDRRTDNTMAKRPKDRQYNDQKTEGQIMQWPKDRRTDNTMAKRQKDRQYNGQKKKDKSTNNDQQNYTENSDPATRTSPKTRDELMYPGRVSSSCSTSGTRRVTLGNPVISHEWRKDREVLTTSGTLPCSFVTQPFRNG
jgi:hypothetical protein